MNMRTFILLLVLFLPLSSGLSRNEVVYSNENITKVLMGMIINDDVTFESEGPKYLPMTQVRIGIFENYLYLYGQFPNVEIIIKGNGIVSFSTFCVSGTEILELPESLKGEYTLEIVTPKYIYFADITLG